MTTRKSRRPHRPMPEDPEELAMAMFRKADRDLEKKLGNPEEVRIVNRVKRKK